MARDKRYFSFTYFDVHFAYNKNGKLEESSITCVSKNKNIQINEAAKIANVDRTDVIILSAEPRSEKYVMPSIQAAIDAKVLFKVEDNDNAYE